MKTVLITGGSRGIGRACVKEFSEAGYNVAFTYLKSQEAARELSEKYGALAIKADSLSEKEIVDAVKAVTERFGSVDVLVNNAGVSSFSLFTDLSADEWNRTFGVNVTGAFLYTRECLRGMISQKYGRIINISSMWGVTGASCEVHYSAAKSALIGMTRALAKELGPSNITVNAVAPGVINTDMNSALSKEDIETLKSETPISRIGEPEEVASAVLYLASEKASFITGDVLNINGGLVI